MGVGKQYRVVIAEDEEEFLGTLARFLEEDGRFEIAGVARDGREAVELVRRMRPDLVVMDIEMPVIDGVEATRKLHDSWPELPVVAISGHDYEERVLEMRDAGAVDYVRKARVEEELADVLAALLVATRTS